MPPPIAPEDERRFWAGVAHCDAFFSGEAPEHHAMAKLVRVLHEREIAYAIAGGMALNAHGYIRVTTSVDVVLTSDGLERLKDCGYEVVSGRTLRDTQHDVRIRVLISAEYPGDGKPKPVRFPEPAGVEIDGVRFVSLECLLELKLASGISAPHRLRDLADVLEVIRIRNLPADFELLLDPSVREKFRELWLAAQHRDPESMR